MVLRLSLVYDKAPLRDRWEDNFEYLVSHFREHVRVAVAVNDGLQKGVLPGCRVKLWEEMHQP